jgi:hypothetical protein
VRPITSVPVALGVWRIDNGDSVVEFRDHFVLFELSADSRGQAKAVRPTPALSFPASRSPS